jgi:2-hydroxychromene-2-carboxylate isomerase
VRPALDFWFFFGSPYTYMTVARIDDVARRYGVDVRWRPFNLRPILHDVGLPKGPFASFPLKMAYMWNDLERRARKHGIPYKKPTQFPVEPELLATKVAIIGFREDWGKEFTKAAFTDNFVHSKVLGTEENVRSQIECLGLKAQEIVVRARSGETEELLARETAEIRALGAFGSPHFVVGRELFWGDDRLEDAIEYAMAERRATEPMSAAGKRGGLFARLLRNSG